MLSPFFSPRRAAPVWSRPSLSGKDVEAGAPIYVLESGGRPTAEAAELWAWIKEHSPLAGKGSDKQEKAPPQHEEEKHEGPPALLTWGSVAQIKKAMREEEKERMRQMC